MTAPTLGVVAPLLTPTTWAVVAMLLVLLAVVTVVCVVRARRLDRLHRRTDAARVGLADALERRGAVALRVADALAVPGGRDVPGVAAGSPGNGAVPPGAEGPAEAAGLRGAARAALDACTAGLRTSGAGFEPCEAAENALTRRLATIDRDVLPADLAGELADAEQLVLLARRVHNDAVRDTLDLRSRRLVRRLRLAGTAPPPAYFEIADPQRRRDPAPPRPVAGSAVPGTGVAADVPSGGGNPRRTGAV